MKELTFLDSDILFSFFAINEDKIKSYNSSGTTGNIELDAILSLVNQLEKNKEIICISEFSILELICSLKRLNSSFKTANILSKIYQICDILPLSDLMIKLAWFIGSNYSLHSGDALHISFCIFNNIDNLITQDNGFYNAYVNLEQDFNNYGVEKLNDFFIKILFSKGIPDTLIRKFKNIENLKIRKI